MTQHEYFFIAISITLGLAITRLLHTVGMLIRAYRSVSYNWSTALWGFCVMLYCLQLWWVGWELRSIDSWTFLDFLVLMAATIFIYGAAEMALPVPEEHVGMNFLEHSQTLGRLSALSMLLYFCVGPYVNITMLNNAALPSLGMPAIGILLVSLMIGKPAQFRVWSLLFGIYTAAIMVLTA